MRSPFFFLRTWSRCITQMLQLGQNWLLCWSLRIKSFPPEATPDSQHHYQQRVFPFSINKFIKQTKLLFQAWDVLPGDIFFVSVYLWIKMIRILCDYKYYTWTSSGRNFDCMGTSLQSVIKSYVLLSFMFWQNWIRHTHTHTIVVNNI